MSTSNYSIYDKANIQNVKNLKFGIVVSEWNKKITEKLSNGAVKTLLENGALRENIIKWEVPGSFELIYGAKRMANSQNLDTIIAVGCIIKGETRHFNLVCEGVIQGIKDLNIIQNTPIIFCVLTDNNIEQSISRSGGKHGNKGVECAIAAIKMAKLRANSK